MVIINKKTNGLHPITQWDLVRIPLSYRDGVHWFIVDIHISALRYKD